MAERVAATIKAPETEQKCSNSCKKKPSFNSSGSPANRGSQLQKTVGNQAVQKLIKSRALQAKLRIGQPNDIYEQEAEKVMIMPAPLVSSIDFSDIPVFPDQVQRKCSNSCKQKFGFNSSGFSSNRILKHKKVAGNQAVQRLIKSGTLQAKLRISQPNDIYEQEADRVAEQVMRMPEPAIQKKQKCPLRSDASCNEDKIDSQDVMRKEASDRIRPSSPLGSILFRQQVPKNPEQSATPKFYDENSAPLRALPLIHRLIYHKDIDFYTDQVTGEWYSQKKLKSYAKSAQNQINKYKTVISILYRKLKELNDNLANLEPNKPATEYINEAFYEEAQVPSVKSKVVSGGGARVLNPYDDYFCYIEMPETEENPFFVFPFWQHERYHQKRCLSNKEKYYEEIRKQEMSSNASMSKAKGKYDPHIEQRAKVKVANEFNDPIFLIKEEIEAYNLTIREIEKELTAFVSGSIDSAAKGPMSLPETYSIHRKASLDQNESLIYPLTSTSPDTHDVLRSSGQPLDTQTRVFFESRFGYDFGDVRVHTDPKAAESVRAVNALAYTVGKNIVFGEGQYAPGKVNGSKLLAHELTHVIQQEPVSRKLETEYRCSNSCKLNLGFNFSGSSAGNQAVQRFIEPGALQAKLKISHLGDFYEQGAYRAVEQLFRMPDPVQISGEEMDYRIGGTTSETNPSYTINDIKKYLSDFNLGFTRGSEVVQNLDTGGWRIFFWRDTRKAGLTDSTKNLILLPREASLVANTSTLFHEATHATRPISVAGGHKTDPTDPEAVWANLEEELMAQYQEILFLRAHSSNTPALARESSFRNDWTRIERMNRGELYRYFQEEAVPWTIFGKIMEYGYVLATFKNDIVKMANSPRVTYILNRVILGWSPEINPPKPPRPTFSPLIRPRENFRREALDSVIQM